METRPPPLFGSLHQSCTQGVALNVPQHHAEMVVLLDREGFESTLPDVSAGMVMFLVPANMSRQQPVNPSAQVPVLPGPENQVEMVGHQAEGQDPHGTAECRFSHHVEERVKIPILMKNLRAGVAPVEDVKTVTTHGGSRGSRHTESPGRLEALLSQLILPKTLSELPVSPLGFLELPVSPLGFPGYGDSRLPASGDRR